MIKITKKRSLDIVERINLAFLKFLEPLTLEETIKRIVHEAIKLVNGHDGRITINTAEGLKVLYSSSIKLKEYPVRKNGHTYRSFTKRKAFVVQANGFEKIYPNTKYKSVIFVPLFYKSESYGVLLIRSYTPKEYTSEELKVLTLFGSMASMTLRKVQLLSEAKKNLEVKDKFIALAAHELRTPLTSMSGYIQLLSRKFPLGSSQESQWINLLLYESNRLTNLIEEILEINRMNAGAMDYSYTEILLSKIVNDAIKQISSSHTYRQIKLEMSSDPAAIIGDSKKLTQSIYNILENALKFSEKKTIIAVSIKKNKTNSIITVKDSGKGIPKEDLPFVFEGFFKSRDNETGGMGLGLFYAKNVITAHKGNIDLKSKVNKGTEVKISLPNIKYD